MPLFWLSLAFLLGILVAAVLSLSTSYGWALAGVGLFIALAPLFKNRLRVAPVRLPPPVSGILNVLGVIPYNLIPLVIALGATRYAAVQPGVIGPDFISFYTGLGEVELEGVVVAPPEDRESYFQLRVEVKRLCIEAGGPPLVVHGRLLVQAPAYGDWHYGDLLRLGGKLETPPAEGNFSYQAYLARQGIYAWMRYARVEQIGSGRGNPFRAALYRLRDRARAVVYQLYPDPEAGLLAGILLGDDSGIPEGLQAAFIATGTSHIIAISGFNIAIIAGLFATLFGRLLGRRRGAVAAVIGIAAYTLLVGASASVVRAALMGGLSLFARQVGRRQDGLNSLAFVAAGMAVFSPQILWDIGFQLSFAATLGLVLYAGPLTQAFQRLVPARLSPDAVQRISHLAGEYFLFTLAAQVVTLPITIYHFQRLSLVALLANPLVLPAQPAVMVLGGLAVLLGLAWLPAGKLAAMLAWPFAAFTVRAVELLARLPGGNLALGPVSLLVVTLFYALLFAGTWAAVRHPAWIAALKPARVLILAAVAALAVWVWRSALAAPDGRLHLFLLDVGSGDAVLIQSPGGRSVLVDGGPSTRTLSETLGRRLPPGRRQLDWLVVAATGEEQVGALPDSLERFPPQNVLWAGPPSGSAAARALQERFAGSEITPQPAEIGQALDLGSGARLRVLAAGKRGAVLLLEWEGFHALLPVGQDFDTLEALQADPLLVPVEALLLAEGGQGPLNPPEWIAKLKPQVVLLSVGAGDREGRPDPAALEAVVDYPLLRTDRNGWIHLSTDGERMWVEVETK